MYQSRWKAQANKPIVICPSDQVIVGMSVLPKTPITIDNVQWNEIGKTWRKDKSDFSKHHLNELQTIKLNWPDTVESCQSILLDYHLLHLTYYWAIVVTGQPTCPIFPMNAMWDDYSTDSNSKLSIEKCIQKR